MNVNGHGGVRHVDFPDPAAVALRRPARQLDAERDIAQPGVVLSLRTPEPPLVYAKPAARLPSRLERPAARQSLSTLRAQVRNLLAADFPDIRTLAKQTIEARLQKFLGVKLDADRTFFNLFEQSARVPSEDGIEFHGHPEVSRCLTDVQLYGFNDLGSYGQLGDLIDRAKLGERTGVHRDGAWGRRFGRANAIDKLTPALLEKLVGGDSLYRAYPDKLSDFWSRNFPPLQALAEVDTLHFAMTHRRSEEPARAIGLETAEIQRLGLSTQAMNMLAEALGRRDPDAPRYHTQVYAFDINGYVSEDMAWLQADDGRVVLIMPDNVMSIREYGSLDLMRADIREMTQSQGGRIELSRHFSRFNRSDGAFYQGVDKWLVDIASGHYNNRISTLRTPLAGTIQEHFDLPDGRGMTLLSDKALGMLSEAAGFSRHAFGQQGTQAFVFDIDTYPSSDMSWLKAEDGHVVLIMPGSEWPVREFENVERMRVAIREMTLSKDGIEELVNHFSIYNRRDGATYQGIDQWLSDIRSGAYDRYIAMAPRAVQGSVFRDQLKRTRDADLERLKYLTQSKANSAVEKRDWLSSYGPNNARLAVAILPEDEDLQSQSGDPMSTPELLPRRSRSLGGEFAEACARARAGLRQWHDSVYLRLRLLVDRLRSAASEGPSASTPAPGPPWAPEGRPRNPPGRAPNDYGFVERNDLNMVYRYELIPSRRTPVGWPDVRHIPERDGFRAQQVFAAGRRMLGGDVADFYLTPEAARRAAMLNRTEGGHFWLYEVDASGLQAVSVGDNRANNPDMETLMQNRGPHTQVQVGGLRMPYTMSDYRWLENDMVQVRMEGDMLPRIVRNSVLSLDQMSGT